MQNLDYAVLVVPLTEAEGGGYMALVPDLHGCMADGETPAEALEAVQDAIAAWLSAQAEMNRPAPEPGSARSEADDQLQILNEYIEKQDALVKSQEEMIEMQTKLIDNLQAELAEMKAPNKITSRAGTIAAGQSWSALMISQNVRSRPAPRLVPVTNKN